MDSYSFKIIEDSAEKLQIKLTWNRFLGGMLFFFSSGFIAVPTWFLLMTDAEMGDNIFGLFVFLALVFILWCYALSLLFNSTYITADTEKLVIQHKPLFSIGKKEILKNNIKRIYVKRIEKSRNGRTHFVYQLWLSSNVKWEDAIFLLSDNAVTSEKEALFMEKKLRNHFRMEDTPLESDYNFKERTAELILEKERKRKVEKQHSLENLQKDSFIAHENKNYQLVYRLQLDWENQQTDFLYQLKDATDVLQLYIKSENRITIPYLETKIDYFDFSAICPIPNDIEDLAPKIKYQNQDFWQEKTKYQGKSFSQNQAVGIPTKQVIYFSESKKEMLRITQQGSTITIQIGDKKEPNQFQLL